MASIVTVLGTRPEIIKLSALLPLLDDGWDHALVHTGQHYDTDMVDVFFHELNLAAPRHMLAVGSGSHAVQTAHILRGVEEVLIAEGPRLVVVQGDTNTTLGATLAATKLGIPVAHIEAGCRSHNRRMPEEQNRIVVDHLAQWLFAPDENARQNLLREGIPASDVFLSGSTGVDACLRNWGYAATRPVPSDLGLPPREYGVVTVHRAENTHPEILRGILDALNTLAGRLPLVFPMHPRTRAVCTALAPSFAPHPRLRITPPLGYLDLLALVGNARVVLTDSGGLQEEAAALQVPTLILRKETEWQTYVNAGIHRLVGTSTEEILKHAETVLDSHTLDVMRLRALPAEAGAAERIAAEIAARLPSDQPIPLRLSAVGQESPG